MVILRLRGYHEMSRNQLARRAQVSTSIVKMIENKNYRPKSQLLDKIAEALNTDYWTLLSGEVPDVEKIASSKEIRVDKKVLWENEEAWALKCQELRKEWDRHNAVRIWTEKAVSHKPQKK